MRRVILFTVFILAVFLVPSYSFAKENVSPTPTPTLAPKPVDYQLPYPGLLPDSPLYFLKIVRDRIIDLLIADSLKQAEFDLLQSEKRLTAGIALFNKGKIELSQSTISKAENYFEKAIQDVEVAQKEGGETANLLEKMYRSVKKQQEELLVLKKNTPSNMKESFSALLKRMQDFEKRVIKLRQ